MDKSKKKNLNKSNLSSSSNFRMTTILIVRPVIKKGWIYTSCNSTWYMSGFIWLRGKWQLQWWFIKSNFEAAAAAAENRASNINHSLIVTASWHHQPSLLILLFADIFIAMQYSLEDTALVQITSFCGPSNTRINSHENIPTL